MEKMKFSQVAKSLGVSLNSVYRKVKQSETELNGHVLKENGVTFLTLEGVEILKGLFSRLNPSETPETKEDPTIVHLKEIVGKQQKTIDNLIAKQAEERQRTDSIIMKLAHDLEDTRRSALAIEAKVNSLTYKPETKIPDNLNDPPAPVQVWHPTSASSDPLEGAGLLERVWVKLVHPERLRRHSEN